MAVSQIKKITIGSKNMKIAVIGAGWLGYRLCKTFLEKDQPVVTTKQSEEDVARLNAEGISCVQFQLGERPLPQTLLDCELYVINIGAGRRGFKREEFQSKMVDLCRQCLESTDKKLLFVSTTSVYGEANQVFTEQTEPAPISDSAHAHVHIENCLRELFPQQVTILRLAGLIGEDRHPVYYLEGKKDITAAHKMVNLVHRDDAIEAIEKIISLQKWGKVFHLSATDNPSRRAYYTYAAKALELIPPLFLDDSEQPAVGKKVDAEATIAELQLTLKFPSPFDMLPKIAEEEVP